MRQIRNKYKQINMKQTRFIPIEDCGLKVRSAEGCQSDRIVEGTPIIFGVRSVNLTPSSETREVYEVLERGCIDEELLQRSDVILNVNHSTKVTDVLGRCRKGTGTLGLTMEDGNIRAVCDMPRTNCGNDTLELIRRGDISGMSFAFTDGGEENVTYENTREVTREGKEVWLRRVRKVTGLYDVAIVTHPAYEMTSVATREAVEEMLRSIDKQIADQMEQRSAEGDKQEEENRKLEEAAERAREMAAFRRRCQRRKISQFNF